ncbi:MAG: TIR domain-containing protein [Steroidobacteraceae bacterium]
MPDLDAADAPAPRPTVFLSYASEDREAARLLGDALPAFGLEVWYDESELGGGEAWDQKIRRQIRECDYFMPLVSAHTEARLEGYFRREWRLAVERTLDMADDHLFLLPIVIDDTDQAVARVPEKFLSVQWLKVPGGRPTRALEALCRRVASGNAKEPKPQRSALRRRAQPTPKAAALQSPIFPKAEPGQRIRFWADVLAWTVRSAWVFFRRLPRWLRVLAYVWIAITLVSRCEQSKHEHSADISPAKVDKLKAISEKYQGNLTKNDIVKLGTQIAKEFSDDSAVSATDSGPLLAIPFTAPAGDAAAAKLADATFAMAYGMLSISHHGQVSLTKDPLPSRELGAALERGRASHATYVLCGTVDAINGAQVLTVRIAAVANGALAWSKSYPAAGADPAKIAKEVEENIPPLAPN